MALPLAVPLALGGLGLLGGAISSQRKFGGYGDIDTLQRQFSDPGRGRAHFQRIARDAAPSRGDLMSLAAATGGSPAAASGQAQQMGMQAADQALAGFGRYRQGLDSLRANLAAQKTGMRQADFNTRREGLTSIFNNVASMGFGMAGNQIGFDQQQSLLEQMNRGGSGGGFQANRFSPLTLTIPRANSGAGYRGWNTLNG